MQIAIFTFLIIGSFFQIIGLLVTARGLVNTHRSLGSPSYTLFRFMWDTPWEAFRKSQRKSGTGTATLQLGTRSASYIETEPIPREAPTGSQIANLKERLSRIEMRMQITEKLATTTWADVSDVAAKSEQHETNIQHQAETQRQQAIDGLRFESWGVSCIAVGLIFSLIRSFLMYLFPH
ncbi:hypothetical protein QFW96_14595 [Saccharopolyspora sp. TS4A08]|uniref:Uncharacterized protein n=1 Tax=Saccharopolyspora ipomoeae TaxID=3042027 RepID=A0ABT6PPM9_9PSEU|nr:hypothetical protein [Saccharopolyspora sp. TS4A08]MDI2029857.1 hypothetical protein [Saccharopolyspora sp. TS4A08]